MSTPAVNVRRLGSGPTLHRPARPPHFELEEFWDHAPVGFGVVDAELCFVCVNDRLARLLHRAQEELVGSGVALAAEPLGAVAADACRQVLRTGTPLLDIPVQPRPTDVGSGDAGAVSVSARPLGTEAGQAPLVALIVEDGARQQALQETLDSRLRFEQLIGYLLARFVDNGDNDVERAIGAALENVGYVLGVDRVTLSEADAETFRVLHSWAAPGVEPVPATFKAADLPWYARQLLRAETVRVACLQDLPAEASQEREMMRRMGTQSHLAIPLSLGQGLVGALAVSALRKPRDWSDELVQRLRLIGQIFASALGRKKSTERLARQQQELAHVGRVAMVGELASILAHDLNQPLAAILTNAQATRRLIEDCGANAHETNEALADIADDANRAGAIIRRLRALLRKTGPSLGATDVAVLLAELEPIVRAELREYDVALKLDLADGLPPAQADAVQLQQVLLNLVSNACHAMVHVPRQRRELTIRTSRGDDDAADGRASDIVRIDVCDTGLPIPREIFQRIFEPFFTTKPTGLGMGLAITRSIIAAHRGRVWATQNPQRGITVHVALPACQ